MLLDVWPDIKAQVEAATLHIFYGSENWEKAARQNPEYASGFGGVAAIEKLKADMKRLESAGVVYHGRISKQQLAEEFCKSGAWLYPTWFTETSCITAMEAQAAGLNIVTSPVAALCETVDAAGVLVPFDEYGGEQHQKEFLSAAVETLLGRPGVPRGDCFSLDSLAVDWSAMLSDMLKQTERRVMPPYYEWSK
jgi:glycosyltransferase involved in cell wall biosynthesis